MIRSRCPLAALLVLPGLLACGDADDPGADSTGEEPAASRPATSDAELEQQAVVLQVQRLPDGTPYLTDVDEMALYLFTADSGGRSSCYDACADAWPPLVGPSATVASGSAALDAELVGTVERRTGQPQITYGGHPLYYYVEDAAPGDVEGQDVHDQGGEWYLVTPEGNALEHRAGGGTPGG